MGDKKSMLKGQEATLAVYSAVVARRLQWDNLLWQVPVVSFTAQAFLLNVSLAPNSSLFARLVSSALASIVSVLCIHLMAKHRQSEVLDAETLKRMEAELPELLHQHGTAWGDRRAAMPRERGLVHFFIRPTGRAYPVWIVGLFAFFVVSATIFVLSLAAPQLLE
ncbi:hypothetical protein QMG83_05000 [Salinibacterium sp. G-O1]|uniref:hypothetical protein n=1 Tax=Salinibacterium sp. G-O1 TaxID=3046208 RepID=UPI0024BB5865|nr:hypothetical protein [Salinibacterium sp. G-O1]MDJ0334575.1 hypothetical protein [Salinibacterium sp. G-O1]